MISLTPRQKAKIRELVKSARAHSESADLLAKAAKAALQVHECYVCGENIRNGYRTDKGTICQECYKKRWEKSVCEQCHKEFGEGYMAKKPDGKFALMCKECYENLWEAVTDD